MKPIDERNWQFPSLHSGTKTRGTEHSGLEKKISSDYRVARQSDFKVWSQGVSLR